MDAWDIISMTGVFLDIKMNEIHKNIRYSIEIVMGKFYSFNFF